MKQRSTQAKSGEINNTPKTMNLDVRYFIPVPAESKEIETACVFHTPFCLESYATRYAKRKLKEKVSNVRNWKLDKEFLNNQITIDNEMEN